MVRNRVLSNAAKNIAAKLTDKYKGPFVITDVISPLVYNMKDHNGKEIRKIYIEDMKPYHARE